MFLKYALLLICSLFPRLAAAEMITLNPPKALTQVIRCSERAYAADIVKAFQFTNRAGNIKLQSYTGHINQYGLRACNEVLALPLLIGALEQGVILEPISGGKALVIVEVRLGLHPEDVDDVGFIIMTAEQYETLTADLL